MAEAIVSSDNEIWKPIIGYEGLYEASNFGRIKSLPKKSVPKERILKPSITTKPLPYYYIGLSKAGKRNSLSVHRLVMSAFFGSSVLHVNHINKNSLDNRLINLEYVSRRENTNHSNNSRRKCLLGSQRRASGKFRAVIIVQGKKLFLGQFDTDQEAHECYLKKVQELGEAKYAFHQQGKGINT